MIEAISLLGIPYTNETTGSTSILSLHAHFNLVAVDYCPNLASSRVVMIPILEMNKQRLSNLPRVAVSEARFEFKSFGL